MFDSHKTQLRHFFDIFSHLALLLKNGKSQTVVHITLIYKFCTETQFMDFLPLFSPIDVKRNLGRYSRRVLDLARS